eukprot:CAMPEP_0203809120 /NCGR_PEP_ID=MMETSP0115-20131106/2057_1 /ASSEMBLY_ACC=CAM_ASM_000227 /TAXON_ID=33651 /ORGANISM="Bicosoecid sp, Strain ms1" /LENGTH=180 /DNA_ID=CAMNT_0050717833 /DNA_START=93 /DNA_END=635 /DNA_ORIENTATION=+
MKAGFALLVLGAMCAAAVAAADESETAALGAFDLTVTAGGNVNADVTAEQVLEAMSAMDGEGAGEAGGEGGDDHEPTLTVAVDGEGDVVIVAAFADVPESFRDETAEVFESEAGQAAATAMLSPVLTGDGEGELTLAYEVSAWTANADDDDSGSDSGAASVAASLLAAVGAAVAAQKAQL